jgi:hypothetical protein
VWCVWQSSVVLLSGWLRQSRFGTAVCGVLESSVNWYTAVWFVAVHICGIAVWFSIHPVRSWYILGDGCMVWGNPYLVLSGGLLQSSAGIYCCT